MIPYDDFLLTDKQVNAIEKANAKSKIIEYIKKNGKEPENIESFYFATDEQIESVKRVVYADYLIQSKNSGNDNEEAVRVDFNFNKEDETFRGCFWCAIDWWL